MSDEFLTLAGRFPQPQKAIRFSDPSKRESRLGVMYYQSAKNLTHRVRSGLLATHICHLHPSSLKFPQTAEPIAPVKCGILGNCLSDQFAENCGNFFGMFLSILKLIKLSISSFANLDDPSPD